MSTVVCGGAPLPEELRAEFTARTGLRIDQGYGLTEAAGVSTTVGGPLLGHGHVGRPLPGVEVRIGTGIGRDEPAEISSAGTTCSPATGPTAPAARTPMAGSPPGDIGYLAYGELFLVDRARS